jgi:carboxypeptidase C (cathepsin A)
MKIRALSLLLALAQPLAAQADEEPIVTTRHDVTMGGRTMRYVARAGRIPIRDNETGDVHGQMFFISYSLDQPTAQPKRPLTFVWNGGPGSNSALVHLIGFGPKRMTPAPGARADDESKRWIIEPNPGTWFGETDLVFVDPIGTGYSRPTRAEYGPEFYQTRGDAESVAEFIRVYRTRFESDEAPLFLAGESYGVTRAAGVAEALQRRGTEVKGVILLGLALPLGTMSQSTRAALALPTLTVAAFTNHKLGAEFSRDLAATMKQAESWAEGDYARALSRVDSLSDTERDSIVRALSRFTGLDQSLIDRKTLVVNRMQLGNYLLRREGKFIGQYDSRMIGPLDTTQAPYDPTKDPSLLHLLDDVMVIRYIRNELGYRSDLRYQGPFGGGYPPPTSFRGDWMSTKWNRPPAATTDNAPPNAGRGGGRGGGPATQTAPLQAAMTMNRSLRVLIACGIYDLVCDYHGNAWAAAHLDPSLAPNVTAKSYPGGHALYTDPRAHLAFARDVGQFIRGAR